MGPGRIGVGVRAHGGERGRPDQARPYSLVHGNAQEVGKPAHLAVQVGLQVGVVKEEDVGQPAIGPEGPVEVGRRPGGKAILGPGVRRRRHPHRKQSVRFGREGKSGPFRQAQPAPDLGIGRVGDVGQVIDHGEERVARIAAAHDVGNVREVRQAIQRGVRLQNPPGIGLGREIGVHVLDRLAEPLDPAREAGQGLRQVGLLMCQQRAQHLGPGRAALGRGAHENVAGAMLERLPAVGVVDRRFVVVDALRQLGHGNQGGSLVAWMSMHPRSSPRPPISLTLPSSPAASAGDPLSANPPSVGGWGGSRRRSRPGWGS